MYGVHLLHQGFYFPYNIFRLLALQFCLFLLSQVRLALAFGLVVAVWYLLDIHCLFCMGIAVGMLIFISFGGKHKVL